MTYSHTYSSSPVDDEWWEELLPVVDLPGLVWVPRVLAHVVEPGQDGEVVGDVERLDVLVAEGAVARHLLGHGQVEA